MIKKLMKISLAALALALLPNQSALALETPETSVSVSGTTAHSSLLPAGPKLIWCTVAGFYEYGRNTSVTASTTTSIPLSANEKWDITMSNDYRYLAFITTGATGTCYIRNVYTR